MAETVKIGIVGCGAMGRRHVDMFTALDEVELVGLMDVNEEAVKKVNEEFCKPRGRTPRFYTSYEEMVAKETMDGVVLVTPHNMHFPQCMHALENGLNVLVEKPMVTSTGHAKTLVEMVEKTGKILLVAFPGACSREHRFVRTLRESGELGEVRNIMAVLGQDWAAGREHLWRQNLEVSGGGQLYDSGSHVINATLWLSDLEPVEVYADINNRGFKVDVTSAVTIKFDNGALANLTILGDSTGPFEHQVRLYADKMTVHVGVFGSPIEVWQGKQKVAEPALPSDPLSTAINFTNSLLGKDTPLCGPEYGLRLAKLMDSIYESGKQHKPIKIG